jgi:hypothetical protein
VRSAHAAGRHGLDDRSTSCWTLDQVVMASKEHDQPALAINVAIGQSVAQSGNKTVQILHPLFVSASAKTSIGHCITLDNIIGSRSAHISAGNTQPGNTQYSSALQALAKAQQANSVPLQPKQQGSRVSTSSIPPCSASKPIT